MQAINHVATALVLKRRFPTTPLFGLVLATEAIEYLWVGLNLLGVEQTVIADPMRSVADVHLAHMPFSHSLASSLVFAALVGMVALWRGTGSGWSSALALSLAVATHIVLDLVIHAPDIALSPFWDGKKLGSGLYAHWPVLALVLESLWGIMCWWIYRGSPALLGLIVVLGVVSIPVYSMTINLGEAALSGHPKVFALVILGQMILATALVWLLARKGAGTAQ